MTMRSRQVTWGLYYTDLILLLLFVRGRGEAATGQGAGSVPPTTAGRSCLCSPSRRDGLAEQKRRQTTSPLPWHPPLWPSYGFYTPAKVTDGCKGSFFVPSRAAQVGCALVTSAWGGGVWGDPPRSIWVIDGAHADTGGIFAREWRGPGCAGGCDTDGSPAP